MSVPWQGPPRLPFQGALCKLLSLGCREGQALGGVTGALLVPEQESSRNWMHTRSREPQGSEHTEMLPDRSVPAVLAASCSTDQQ